MTTSMSYVNKDGTHEFHSDATLLGLYQWLGRDLRELGATSSVFERLGDLFDLAQAAEATTTQGGGEIPDEAVARAKTKTVKLAGGGTLTVSATLDLFSLGSYDREFILGLINSLEEYEKTLRGPLVASWPRR